MRAARRFILYFFPCSADHERDWPPCKVLFSWLAINALNVRNNNNNNNMHIYGLSKNCTKQHFGEIKNEVFFKERGLLSLKGPVG